MAELTFYFAPMRAGKSALLLNTAFHLRQAGRRVLILTLHDRADGRVTSRVGLSAEARSVTIDMDLRSVVLEQGSADVVLVDEAQFLSADQVDQLASLVDDHGIDVYAHGLRTDFTNHAFDGSRRLFEVADQVEALQVQARCWCGRPATHNARTLEGVLQRTGEQVVVDDGSAGFEYEVLCRAHWRAGLTRAAVGVGDRHPSLF